MSVGRERDEVDVFVLGHGQDALCGVSAFNADPGRDSASNQRVALALELAASVVFAGLRG